MGLTVFILLAGLEIAMAVWICRTGPDKKALCKRRLSVRAAQTLIVIAAVLLPLGQRWRFVPVLVFLGVLLVIAGLAALAAGKRADRARKPAGTVLSCALFLLCVGLFLAPAFLFSGYKGLPVSGGHPVAETSAILIDGSRTDPFEQDGSFREVPVHLYYPADGSGEKYPLVVFSHGAFGYYQSNTSTYMELASSGYVVAALDHPHHAFFTQDTDGGIVTVDRDFINTAMNLSEDMDPREQYALYTQWMALRTADMSFAVDEIKAAAETGTPDGSWHISDGDSESVRAALAMTDPSRIGLMGHSMGGAASVELGRERDDIAAVIDLDGTMLGEYQGVEDGEPIINDAPYTVPVLEFNNWESYIEREQYLAQGGRYPNNELIGRADDGSSTVIRGTKHMDFTDLPMFSPLLGQMLGSGERSTEETMTIVNSLVLSFFDCYLKGEGVFTVQDIY